MSKYWMGVSLGAPILFICFVVALGQTSEPTGLTKPGKSGPSDLSGMWLFHPIASTSAYSSFAFSKATPAMTPWAEEKYKAAKPALGPNKIEAHQSNDPVYGCFPPGLPRIYLHPKPIEIVQLPDEVVMMFEYDRIVRHIYTDGRPHDEFLDPPLWMGDSVGKWEGDTLVIDVIGFNDLTWLDRAGHPHSEALHVTERLRRVDHDTLSDDITIEDPKAYTKSWTVQARFQLKPELALNWEGVCEDEKLVDRQ
jgi:hypothetical protein